MTTQDRKNQAKTLFNKIAFIAEVLEENPQERDKHIQPFVEELYNLTKIQNDLGELQVQITFPPLKK